VRRWDEFEHGLMGDEAGASEARGREQVGKDDGRES